MALKVSETMPLLKLSWNEILQYRKSHNTYGETLTECLISDTKENQKESLSEYINSDFSIFKPQYPVRHSEAMRGMRNSHKHSAINTN